MTGFESDSHDGNRDSNRDGERGNEGERHDSSAGLRRDAAAREAAQRVFDRPIVLEAGAGTGKTSTLVARIVAWCLGPGWQKALERRAGGAAQPTQRGEVSTDDIAADVLSRVAAITFTEAAAAEMAERTGLTLAAVAKGELWSGLAESALPADREERSSRAAALLGELDHLVVRTIHAFCRSLLARHPLESGLHPNFQVDADMRLQADVVREVVEETVRAGYASQDSPLLELALAGHGAREVEETLAALVAEGVAPRRLASNPFTPQRVEHHLAGLRAALVALRECEQGQLAGVPARAKKTHAALGALDVSQALAESCKAEGLASLDSLEALCQGLAEAWKGQPLSRIVEWSKAKLIGSEAEALGGQADEFCSLAAALLPWLRALLDLSPRQLEASRTALVPMLEKVEAELRARGIATFASLLSGAQGLLATRQDVARRVRLELDQLMVDEFQDTDGLQCSIVRQLALSGPESERPGLFLVGDPKQSIYGWRSADLAAYDGFVREVEQAGGELHSLSVNFRSVPAILDEVERAIAPVMLRSPGLQPRFERLEASQALVDDEGFLRGRRAPVEYWVSWGCADGIVDTKLSSGEASAIEAEALAEDLVDLHDNEGVAWRDMGLLFRGMGDLEDYLSALRTRGVPYAVERDRNYYRRREVIDAAAFVRCVLDPNDHLALVTALRSPAVGVPDAALIPLWSRAFPALVTELYGRDAGAQEQLAQIAGDVALQLQGAEVPGLERVEGWELSLCAMLETLGALRESFDRDPADSFVERLRTGSLLEVSEAARYLGAFRVANLDRFFRELRAGLMSGSDAQAVLRQLRSDIGRGRDGEEQRPVGDEEDAVPVMTIHKAKGLDFEHVYLVQLHKRSRPDTPPATAVVECEGVAEYRVFGQSTLGFETARAEARRVEAAERVRTLYVAMTRAKRRLVLIGNFRPTPETVPFERAASHIDLLAGRLAADGARADVDLVALMEACAEAGEVFRDAACVRWVFPALIAKGKSVARSAREPEGLLSPPEIAREHSELAALQSAAKRRMALRWGGAASHGADAQWVDEAGTPALAETARRAKPRDAKPRDTESRDTESRDVESRDAELARAASMAAGEAIHRVLEEIDLAADPQEEFARQRLGLAKRVDAVRLGSEARRAEEFRSGALKQAALERAGALLDRFADGELARRLFAIAPHIVARELEVWLPGIPEPSEAQSEAGGPLRYVAGAIDLVYRDGADGEWVVVDYKTDRVASREAADERAKRYASQGAFYTRAVQQALGLDARPRFELWFLDADLIVLGSE